MFDCDMQELAQFVPNYTLNILSPAEIMEPEKFKSSLQQALQVIKYSNDKDKLREVVNADPKFRKIDLTTAKMLSFNTNYKLTDKLEGGYVNMCKAFDDIKLEGKMEERNSGILKMISTLREFDICDADITKKIMEKYNLDLKSAEVYMAM